MPIETTVGPTQWLHRRTPVDAMKYDGSELCRGEIADWVADQGGSADLRFDGSLLVRTPIQWAVVPSGWWVVRGLLGQFFVIEDAVFVGCYDPSGANFNAILTRNQAAAIVVAIDELAEAAGRESDLAKAAIWIHQLAGTVEALR